MFTKHTQSEDHKVVTGNEREVIRKHAGADSAQKLGELEKDRMLQEVEDLRESKQRLQESRNAAKIQPRRLYN